MAIVALELSEVRRAVAQESEAHMELLPTRTVDRAARGDVKRVAEYALAAISREMDLVPAEVTYARKSRQGLRPLTILSFIQRVHLRALVNRLRGRFPEADRSGAAHQAFTSDPLSLAAEKRQYIIQSDVADFYRYVDHATLGLEIVRRSGEDAVPTGIVETLGAYMDAGVGLPQTNSSSDWLSEVYIDVAERDLRRRGMAIWRYNDDFRIAASSWLQAHSHLEELVDSLGDLGLTINDSKTYILRSSTYERWLEEPDRTWEDATQRADLDLEFWSTYDEEDEEDEEIETEDQDQDQDEEEIAAAALRALEYWAMTVGVRGDSTGDRMQAEVSRRLLRKALSILGTTRTPKGLDDLRPLLMYEPQLTPDIAKYMTRLSEDHGEAVSTATSELGVKTLVQLSEWQNVWLLEPFIEYADLTEPLREWATRLLSRATTMHLRGRAAMALASEGAADIDELKLLYQASDEAARPDVVAALVFQNDGPIDDDLPEVYANDVMSAVVADWAAEKLANDG